MASGGLVNDNGGLSYTHPIRRCRLRFARGALRFSRFGARARRMVECELAVAAVQLWLAASTDGKTASRRKLG